TVQFVRRGLNLTSVSSDGTRLPHIFIRDDVERGNCGELDYYPSAVESIDNVPIFQWLEDDAARNTANFQDPDAQFNNLFSSIPRQAAGMSASAFLTSFEIPDNYTIYFYNGSSLVVENEIVFLPIANFTNIGSGEDVHKAFEIPPTVTTETTSIASTTPSASASATTSSEEGKQPTEEVMERIPGYPYPVVKNSKNNIAGYFLNDTGFEDTVVLSVLSFLPANFDPSSGGDLNTTEFVLEAEQVVVELFKKAKEDNRDKLIIDLSANGGGSVTLAEELYRLLFPDGEFTGFNRYRANRALEASSEASYKALVKALITQTSYLPINSTYHAIKTGKEWFGPYRLERNAKVTEAYQLDKKKPYDPDVDAYYNGFNPDKDKNPVKTAPFKPENIIIVTDGICGRPINFAMQAMGGVKGTLLLMSQDLTGVFTKIIDEVKGDEKALSILEDAKDSFPGTRDAPLLPLLTTPAAGKLNAQNGYTLDDLDGYPVHFRYEAAHCKLPSTTPLSPPPLFRQAK
ncbi:hypothetical protein BFJ67_g17839, partial [Fusarium oxysporum f. sp. cepae]